MGKEAAIRRRLLVALIILAAGALLVPGAALAQRRREVLKPGPLPAGADLSRMQDSVLGGKPRASISRVARARAASHAYLTPDGLGVQIDSSPAYAPDPASDQAMVRFLASRLHGRELGHLRVYVGTPREIADICGSADAVACYAPDEDRMYVPGEESHGVPTEYAITHEYGHHIEKWRDNDPWDALDWGPKYWSSSVRVCAHVLDRDLFPGDQGDHYADDPGEGFADAYAHYHYPRAPWQFNALMRPNRDALRAIVRDVRHPWTRPRKEVLSGRLGPGRSARRFRLRLHLDGDLSLRLKGPRSANFNLIVRWRHELVARTRRAGSRDTADIGWCRASRTEVASITVTRRSGAGSFRLVARYAG